MDILRDYINSLNFKDGNLLEIVKSTELDNGIYNAKSPSKYMDFIPLITSVLNIEYNIYEVFNIYINSSILTVKKNLRTHKKQVVEYNRYITSNKFINIDDNGYNVKFLNIVKSTINLCKISNHKEKYIMVVWEINSYIKLELLYYNLYTIIQFKINVPETTTIDKIKLDEIINTTCKLNNIIKKINNLQKN